MRGNGKEFWVSHLAALDSQAKPMTVYAREQGLSVHALGWWRRKLKAPVLSGAVESESSKPAFVSLQLSETTAAVSVTLSLGGGLRLQLPTLPSVQWLVTLSRAMRDEA